MQKVDDRPVAEGAVRDKAVAVGGVMESMVYREWAPSETSIWKRSDCSAPAAPLTAHVLYLQHRLDRFRILVELQAQGLPRRLRRIDSAAACASSFRRT